MTPDKRETEALIHKTRLRDWAYITLGIFTTVGLISFFITLNASAETRPGGTDNGLTSRLLTLSNTLSSLGHGSTTDSPDWGQHWNRVSTAAKWVPNGDVTAADVKKGKKFYNGSRTEQTGTYSTPGVCPTESYNDNHASATQVNNCVSDLTWTVPSDGVTGNDKKDPRTGLIWSQALTNSGGVITFTASTPTALTYDNSGASNTSKTAIQLCSERGDNWRLPSHRELLQAYIDGSHFHLTNPGYSYWSKTIDTSLSRPFFVSLSGGFANTTYTNYPSNYIRCVR